MIEALADPRIQFTPEEWRNLVVSGLDSKTLDGDLMMILGQTPELIRRGRQVLESPRTSDFSSYEVLLEVYYLQDAFRPVLNNLRERYDETERQILEDGLRNAEAQRMVRCFHLRMYAFGLAVGILINSIRYKLEGAPCAHEVSSQESSAMAEEILKLAKISDAYRPLGSLAMSLFLGAAWVGANNADLKRRVDDKAQDFCNDVRSLEKTFENVESEWCRKPFGSPLPTIIEVDKLMFGGPLKQVECKG